MSNLTECMKKDREEELAYQKTGVGQEEGRASPPP